MTSEFDLDKAAERLQQAINSGAHLEASMALGEYGSRLLVEYMRSKSEPTPIFDSVANDLGDPQLPVPVPRSFAIAA